MVDGRDFVVEEVFVAFVEIDPFPDDGLIVPDGFFAQAKTGLGTRIVKAPAHTSKT